MATSWDSMNSKFTQLQAAKVMLSFPFFSFFFHVFFLFWISFRTSFFSFLSFLCLLRGFFIFIIFPVVFSISWFFSFQLCFSFSSVVVGFFLKSYQLILSFFFTCYRVMWCGLNLTPRPKADPKLRPQGCYQHTTWHHEWFFCFVGSAEWQAE